MCRLALSQEHCKYHGNFEKAPFLLHRTNLASQTYLLEGRFLGLKNVSNQSGLVAMTQQFRRDTNCATTYFIPIHGKYSTIK